jgi:hypothetical protein
MNQRMPRTAAAGLFAALVINGSLWLTVDSTNSALAAAEPAAAVETPADEGWVIRSEATMPDGATGLATVTLRVRDQDHFVIESSDRIVAGVAEPEFTLVIARQPPAPAAPGAGDTEDVEDADD